MKRTANGVAGYDTPEAKEHFVPVSKVPTEAKVVWHVDPVVLVGPREEEARRKAPEGKFLYAISAFLTIMVLWGIFRQVHYIVPHIFSSSSGGASSVLEEPFTLDQLDSDSHAFQAVDDSDVGGRRAAKHLLEIHAERFFVEKSLRLRAHSAGPHKSGYLPQEPPEYIKGSAGTVVRRREVPT